MKVINENIFWKLVFSTKFKNRFKKYKEKSLIECKKNFWELDFEKRSWYNYNCYRINKNEKTLEEYSMEELVDLLRDMKKVKMI